MKPAIRTEEIHTINFYTSAFQSEHNLAGLDKLVAIHSHQDVNLTAPTIHNTTIQNTLEHIMPEALDNLSCERLKTIYQDGVVTLPDLRILIQWLVNMEVLPAGTYRVVF